VAEAFKIGELNGFALLRVEEAHQRANSFGAAFFIECFLVFRRRSDGRQLVGLIFAAALSFAFQAKRVQGAVPRQSEQPGNKGTARGVVLRSIAAKLQENVLHDFLGRSLLLLDAQNQGIDAAGMAIVKLLKGAHIFLKKPMHKRRVRQNFGDRRWYKSRQEHGIKLLRLLCRYTADYSKWMSSKVRLLRAPHAYFFGDGQGLVDTRADGGSSQIITDEPDAWKSRSKLLDPGKAVGMTEIVLWQRARPNGDIRKDGGALDGQQR
jgi:hypothetical protein